MLSIERVQYFFNLLALVCLMAGFILFCCWFFNGEPLPDDVMGVVMSGFVIYGG